MPIDLASIFGPPPVLPADPGAPFAPALPSDFPEDDFQQSMLGTPLMGQPEPAIESDMDVIEPQFDEGGFQGAVNPAPTESYFGSPEFNWGRAPEAPPPEFMGAGTFGGTGVQFGETEAGPLPPAIGFGDTADLDDGSVDLAAAKTGFTAAPRMGALTPLQEYERQTQYGIDPAQLVAEDAQRETDRQRHVQEQAAAADAEHQERAAEVESDRLAGQRKYREAVAALDAESKATANDTGLSGFQKAAGIVAAALQGFLNPKGPNSAVAMLQQTIAANRAERRANYQQQRASLGDQYQLDREMYADDLRAEAATWESAKQQALAAGANFDPAGTQAAAVRQHVGQFEGQRQAALEKAGQLAFDNELKVRDDSREGQKSAIELAKYEADERRRRAAAAGAGARNAQKEREAARDDYVKSVTAGIITPKQGDNPYDRRTWEGGFHAKSDPDAAGKAADREEKRLARAVNDPSQPDGIMRDVDGKPVIARSEAGATKANDGLIAAGSIVEGLRDLEEIRQRSGIDIGEWSSDDKKRANSILADIKTKYAVARGQGAISEGDASRYEEIFGASASGLKDQSPKWDSLETTFTRDVNKAIGGVSGSKTNWGVPARPSLAAPETALVHDKIELSSDEERAVQAASYKWWEDNPRGEGESMRDRRLRHEQYERKLRREAILEKADAVVQTAPTRGGLARTARVEQLEREIDELAQDGLSPEDLEAVQAKRIELDSLRKRQPLRVGGE